MSIDLPRRSVIARWQENGWDEPCKSRGLRTVLREARGEIPRATYLVVTITSKRHWLWRAVDQHGAVLDVLVQTRRDRHAARRLMRKLLKKHGRAPRVLITDKLKATRRRTGISG